MADDERNLPATRPPSGALSPSGAGSVARMRTLLDRALPAEDLEEATELVARGALGDATRTRSILGFVVGAERLAIDAGLAHRVVPASVVRRVPHRASPVFAGIANVGGELTLVARLAPALGIAEGPRASHFIVIGAPGGRWAFGVDLVEGVRRVSESSFLAPPTTLRHAADGCAAHLCRSTGADGREEIVTVLDPARILELFARSLA